MQYYRYTATGIYNAQMESSPASSVLYRHASIPQMYSIRCAALPQAHSFSWSYNPERATSRVQPRISQEEIGRARSDNRMRAPTVTMLIGTNVLRSFSYSCEPRDAARVGDYLASKLFFKYETRNYALQGERPVCENRPAPAAAAAYHMSGNESACNYRCVFACALCFKASDDAPRCSQSGHYGKTTLCLQRRRLFS